MLSRGFKLLVYGDARIRPRIPPPAREVVLLQRKAGKLGAGLGKTTGWIHRATPKMKGVQMINEMISRRTS